VCGGEQVTRGGSYQCVTGPTGSRDGGKTRLWGGEETVRSSPATLPEGKKKRVIRGKIEGRSRIAFAEKGSISRTLVKPVLNKVQARVSGEGRMPTTYGDLAKVGGGGGTRRYTKFTAQRDRGGGGTTEDY